MAPRKQPGESLDNVPGCPEASEPGQAAGEGRGFNSLTLAAPQGGAGYIELFVWQESGGPA